MVFKSGGKIYPVFSMFPITSNNNLVSLTLENILTLEIKYSRLAVNYTRPEAAVATRLHLHFMNMLSWKCAANHCCYRLFWVYS